MKTSGEVNHSLPLPEMPSAPTVVECQENLKGRHKIYFGNLPEQTNPQKCEGKDLWS